MAQAALIEGLETLVEMAKQGELIFLHGYGWMKDEKHMSVMGGTLLDYFSSIGAIEDMKDSVRAKYEKDIEIL